MTYPAITARRMPYDIDGAEIGYRSILGQNIENAFSLGIDSWLSSGSKNNLNGVQRTEVWDASGAWYERPCSICFWFFFPEKREISNLALYFTAYTAEENWDGSNPPKLQGSNDTTNGMDGTWEDAVVTIPIKCRDTDYWRSTIVPVSFSENKKTIRLGLGKYNGDVPISLTGIHLYGQKAAGQTPDDILLVDASTGAEFTALKDWGDRPEGTTVIWSFKLKNASTGKIANNVNVQLNHADFTIAWASDGPWQSTLDIASIGVGALSNTIYVRNQLAPPLLTLGPKQARVIATVGSWT